jgi:4'-phosphopantetheinyl transferase
LFPSPDPRVSCLLQSLDANPGLAAGIPPLGLLTPAEQSRFEAFIIPKRRRDWLLGRWTAKHLVRAYLAAQGFAIPLEQIEITAGDDGAPYVMVGERLPLSLSISHSGADSLCAVCSSEAGHIGADVEQIEPREPSFIRTFFTPAELAAIERVTPGERDILTNALWSAKESVLKALRLGLRADTRQVDVRVSAFTTGWSRVAVTLDPALLPQNDASVLAWCQIRPAHVLTLALLAGE